MTDEPHSITDRSEFRRLLHAGHGRAILFLQTNDSTPYHDIILDACLHHPAYDKQSEGTRGLYMLEVMQATGEIESYRRSVLDALDAFVEAEDADDYDGEHLCSIVRWLAEEGDQEAHNALYEFVTPILESGGEIGVDKIVALDGIQGFKYIVTIVDHRTQSDIDSTFFYDGWYISILEDKYGKEHATALLEEVAEQNKSVAAYLQAVTRNKVRQERNREKRANRRYEDYAALCELIKDNASKDSRRQLSQWGRRANDADLARVAFDLLEAQADEDILNYLSVFRLRVFPLDPSRLIVLTEREDDAIQEATYAALEELNHPMVRAHALDLLEASQHVADAIGLLRSNFEEGDQSLICQVLTQPLTDDEIHSIGLSVLYIVGTDPRPDDVEMLMALYEREPCSLCREYTVDALIALDKVPQWMIAECRYDANPRLRETIREKYGSDDYLPEDRKQ